MKREIKNPDIDATVRETGEKLKVYKLKSGTPTEKHLYCDATPFNESSGRPFGDRTFTADQLTF